MLLVLALLVPTAPALQETTWTHQQRFESNWLGSAIAVDGDTAAFGGSKHVLVFVRQNGTWIEQANLASVAPASQFGAAVALFGERLAVGDPGTDEVFLYVRSGSTWALEDQLAGTAEDQFGTSVALGQDTLLVGAPWGGGGPGFGSGQVHVVQRIGGVWTTTQILQGPFSEAYFGASLQLEGDTAAVGAPDMPPGPGQVFVFSQNAGVWSEQAVLQPESAGGHFGHSLALWGDTLLVGEPSRDSGYVHVFVGAGASWAHAAVLEHPAGETYDGFGESLALEGDTALVGAPDDYHGACTFSLTGWADAEGSAFLFRRSNGIWSQVLGLASPDAADGELFGTATAIEGNSLFVGAPWDVAPIDLLDGIEGLAFDAASGTLFGTDARTDELVSIDLETAVPTPIGLLGYGGVRGLAFDSNTGVLYGSDVESGLLLSIDPVEGTATPIGPIGFPNVEGLACDAATGQLYGAGRGCPTQTQTTLLWIDTVTGAGSVIGVLSNVFGQPEDEQLYGLEWDTATNQLYGVGDFNTLLLIGPRDAVVTWTNTFLAGAIRSLARGPGEILYGTDRTQGRLWTIDPVSHTCLHSTTTNDAHALASDPITGTVYAVDRTRDELAVFEAGQPFSTYVGPVGFDEIAGLAYDPASGLLYGADVATDQLVAIDPATGAGTAIGPFGFGSVEALDLEPLSGVLYGVTSNQGRLLSIDKATGAATEIAVIGNRVWGLAPDGMGGLYAVDNSKRLLAIAVPAGTWTELATTEAALALAYGSPSMALAISKSTGALVKVSVPSGNVTPVTWLPPTGAVHEFAVDLAVSYCTAGTSASGCQAMLAASGNPSASLSEGFALAAMTVEGSKDGLFFFGTNGQQANPWGNGTSYQCVAPPVRRAGLLSATGTVGLCDGAFAQDLNAFWCPGCPKPGANPGAGATVQAQLWYRDPASTSNQPTSLSNAIEFPVGP